MKAHPHIRILTAAIAAVRLTVSFGQTVTWDGGGGDCSWHTAANWSNDEVPGPTNDVVIGITNVTITHASGSTVVKSLQCAAGLEVAGGSLTVTNGTSQIDGPLTLRYYLKLAARHAGTVLTVNGTVAADLSVFECSAGATLRLPQLRELDARPRGVIFTAKGAGSFLDLSTVTNVLFPRSFWAPDLRAEDGGRIDFSKVRIQGGGRILANTSGTQSRLQVGSGGTLLLPGVTELEGADVLVHDTGSLASGPLRAVTRAAVSVFGAVLSWPELVDIEGTTFSYYNGGGILFPPAVDLVVTDLQAPAAAVAGQLIELSWSVENQSTNPASGTRSDAVSLSADRAVGNDLFVGHFGSTAPLPAGATGRFTNTVIVPSNLEGGYYVLVTADSLHQFFEGDGETNNSSIALTPLAISAPDLQVTSVEAPSSAPSPSRWSAAIPPQRKCRRGRSFQLSRLQRVSRSPSWTTPLRKAHGLPC